MYYVVVTKFCLWARWGEINQLGGGGGGLSGGVGFRSDLRGAADKYFFHHIDDIIRARCRRLPDYIYAHKSAHNKTQQIQQIKVDLHWTYVKPTLIQRIVSTEKANRNCMASWLFKSRYDDLKKILLYFQRPIFKLWNMPQSHTVVHNDPPALIWSKKMVSGCDLGSKMTCT